MMTFNAFGLAITDQGMSGAQVDWQGIRVTFTNGSSVWLSKALIEHAQSIIEYDAEKKTEKKAQRSAEQSTEESK